MRDTPEHLERHAQAETCQPDDVLQPMVNVTSGGECAYA